MRFDIIVRSEDQVDLKDETGLVWSQHASVVDALIMIRHMREEDAKRIADIEDQLETLRDERREAEQRADALLELEADIEGNARYYVAQRESTE